MIWFLVAAQVFIQAAVGVASAPNLTRGQVHVVSEHTK